MHKHVAHILAGLAELGLADDTIVVYTSQHTHLPGEHRLLNKNVLYAPIQMSCTMSSAPLTATTCAATYTLDCCVGNVRRRTRSSCRSSDGTPASIG